MEAISRIEQLRDELNRARAVPLSASCVVNRKEMLDIIEAALAAMPADLERAAHVLAQRDQIIEQATSHARELVERGQAKQAELVTEHSVYQAALAEADAERSRGEADAAEIRAKADDYVDSKLAQFEVVLSRIATTVADGRARLSGRSEYDALPANTPAASPVTLSAGEAVPSPQAERSLPDQREFDSAFESSQRAD